MAPAPTGPPPPTGWRSFRRDPAHAPELAVLNVLPLLSPRVAQWRAEQVGHETREQLNRLAHRTLHGSVRRAREAGIITGSSFYVGMGPAVAMIYCEQLLLVLRIAAIYGRDPQEPARAAELLVFQRSYKTVASAELALRSLGSAKPKDDRLSRMRRLLLAVQRVPPMIGFQLRRLSSPLDMLIVAAEIAAFFVPVLSIPVWAYASGQSTRRLGRAAILYYRQVPRSADFTSTIALPKPPTHRVRQRFVITLTALILTLGIVAPFIPLGRSAHFLPLGGIVLAEVALVLTGLRLLLITRPPRSL